MAFPVSPTNGQIHSDYTFVAKDGTWDKTSYCESIGTFEKPGKSAYDIKLNNPNAKDGVYWIKPDTHTGDPFKVYCNMEEENGGWTLVFRHDGRDGVVYTNETEARLHKPGVPNRALTKYSILDYLDHFLRDGKWEFYLNYPLKERRNHWKQSHDPRTSYTGGVVSGPVDGYEAINIDLDSNYWGGLANAEYTGTYIDGSIGHSNWYYAIGSYLSPYDGHTFPGSSDLYSINSNRHNINVAELWVR